MWKTTKLLDSLSQDQDLNPRSPEYKARMLAAQPQCSVPDMEKKNKGRRSRSSKRRRGEGKRQDDSCYCHRYS
jgi:hypothetical protein